MQQTKSDNHTASRVIGAVILCLWFASPVWSDADKNRKNTAKSFAKEIEKAQFHKVYVPDFLDPAGTRTEKGCYFASALSTNLAKASHNFEVVNRIQAQKQLNELNIAARDLVQPEMLAKAAQALGADAVLVGTATITAKDANLPLSLRDAASGKEVDSMNYHEKLEAGFESSFPTVEDATTHFYYFPGLDGVSQPKCIYCPNPDYTDQTRAEGIEGSVLLSVRIDENGTITNVRVIETPHPDLAKQSFNTLKKWRLEPSHDPDGRAIAIRAQIEITFHFLHSGLPPR